MNFSAIVRFAPKDTFFAVTDFTNTSPPYVFSALADTKDCLFCVLLDANICGVIAVIFIIIL